MIHKWFYRFIRRRTAPIPEDTALLWKRRLSLAYGFFAWNAFGLVVYSFYQGKGDWAHFYGLKTDEEMRESPAKSWSNALGKKNVKVVRISGLTKVDEYELVDGMEQRTQNKETKDSELLKE